MGSRITYGEAESGLGNLSIYNYISVYLQIQNHLFSDIQSIIRYILNFHIEFRLKTIHYKIITH